MVINVYKDRVEFSAPISLLDGIDIGMFVKENNLKIDEFFSNKILVNMEFDILAILKSSFDADIVIKRD